MTMTKTDEEQQDAAAEAIHALQQDVFNTALNAGWHRDWVDAPCAKNATWVTSKIALIHSELSEALEEVRTESIDDLSDVKYCQSGKPEGFGIEMADAVIRIMDLCEALGVDLATAIIEKARYNKTRPYRHGGKEV